MRFSLALLLMLMLSACGFHLRGQYSMPETLQVLDIHVPKDATELKQQLQRMLEYSGVHEGKGGYRLVITRENITQQASIFDPRVQLANTHVVYTLEYKVESGDGKLRLTGRPILEQNDFQSSPNQINGSSSELDLLITEMRKDAVSQLGRRLEAIKPSQFTPYTGNAP
ncbi:MAG: hypothetical protein HKM02_10845 [Pseudomonadales bacterium]|nr:hypothetical protein [Pseudomonadales bacterium]